MRVNAGELVLAIVFLVAGIGLLAGRGRMRAHQVQRIGRPFLPRATMVLAVVLILVGLLWLDQSL